MNFDEFLSSELAKWQMATENFARIGSSEAEGRLATLSDGGLEVWQSKKIFVNHRRASITAKTDSATIALRRCFLCRENRPEVQSSIKWRDYEVLINPYPLASKHFTVASMRHEPQCIKGRIVDMASLARVSDGMCVFYNGARCGASAPDHLHFQTVSTELLPNLTNRHSLGDVLLSVDGVRLMRSEQNFAPYPFFIIESTDDVMLEAVMSRLFDAMAEESSDESEPPVNIVMKKTSEDTPTVVTWVIPRSKHRPECYGRADNPLLVSPATIEMLGTIVCSRIEDFNAVSRSVAENILSEVGVSESRFRKMIEKFMQTR